MIGPADSLWDSHLMRRYIGIHTALHLLPHPLGPPTTTQRELLPPTGAHWWGSTLDAFSIVHLNRCKTTIHEFVGSVSTNLMKDIQITFYSGVPCWHVAPCGHSCSPSFCSPASLCKHCEGPRTLQGVVNVTATCCRAPYADRQYGGAPSLPRQRSQALSSLLKQVLWLLLRLLWVLSAG